MLKAIKVSGFRDDDKLKSAIDVKDLVLVPADLFEKYYKGTTPFRDYILSKNPQMRLTAGDYQANPNMSRKEALLNALSKDMEFFISDAKSSMLYGKGENAELAAISSKFMSSFTTLERHTFDLSSFSKEDFEDISKLYKKTFESNSPFVFSYEDYENRLIHITESSKTLTITDEEYMNDNGKLTKFFASISTKGRNEDGSKKITNGLNFHHHKKKNFNFNLHVEAQRLYDSVYIALNLTEKDIGVAFKYGDDENTLYFKSDLDATEPTEIEKKYRALQEAVKESSKAQTADRRESISPAKMDDTIDKRDNRYGIEKKTLLQKAQEKMGMGTSPSEAEKSHIPHAPYQLEVIEDDYTNYSVARAKKGSKMYLLNSNREIISDACDELEEPTTLRNKNGNATYVIGKKSIQDTVYYGAIGFNGKNIIDFNKTTMDEVHEEIVKKLKEVKQMKKDDVAKHQTSNSKQTPPPPKTEAKSTTEILRDSLLEAKQEKMDAWEQEMMSTIQNAVSNKEKYVQEFFDLIKTGNGIDFAVDRLKERHTNNPFIFNLITAQIKIELESLDTKDEIINMLDINLEKANNHITELQELITQKDESLSKLSKDYGILEVTFKNTVSSFENKLEELREEFDKKEKLFKEVTAAKDDEIINLLEEVKRLQKLNENVMQKNKSLEKDVIVLQEQNKSLEKEIISRDKIIGLTEQSNENLKNELSIGRKEIKDIVNSKLSLEAKIERLESERDAYLKRFEESNNVEVVQTR